MRSFPWAPDELLIWRLDTADHAATWDSGEGARLSGGRWNPRGFAAVYGSVDPSTAILEVAAHKSFRTLDAVAHVLSCARCVAVHEVHVTKPGDLPNSNWLRPGIPGIAQQEFGEALLRTHSFVAVPSVTSEKSWNLLFNPDRAKGKYELIEQTPFALDTRLDLPT